MVPGGLLNTCYNAVDRHASGSRGDQLALIYDSPVTGVIQTFTYRELRDRVARVAGVLRHLGVGKGDRVLIFMPNTPEAVMTMLASARLGAVHSVVFGGFAAPELAARIDDAQPKVIVWASCGIEPGGSSLTSHSWTVRSRWLRTSPTPAWCCSERGTRRHSSLDGISNGQPPSAMRSPWTSAFRCWRPIRSTSCIRRAPLESPRESFTTTAATPSP